MLRSKSQRNRFAPSFDCLEDRRVPATTTTQSGNNLNIQGDDTADTVIVIARGNNTYTVMSNGVAGAGGTTTNYSNVRNINLNLGEGNNVVRLDLQQAGQLDATINGGSGNDLVVVRRDTVYGGAQTNLTMNLGEGDNTFRLFQFNSVRNAPLNVTMNSGAGADTVVFYDSLVARNSDTDVKLNLGDGNNAVGIVNSLVDRDSDINYNITTGAGDDNINIDIANISRDASVEVNANTGAGNDFFHSRSIFLDRDSQYTINADMGAGDDTFIAIANFIWSNADYHVTANLGDGDDTAIVLFNTLAQGNTDLSVDLDAGNQNNLPGGNNDRVFFALGANRKNISGHTRNFESQSGFGPGR